MQLTFLGATRQVTGSCYLLEHGRRRILIDCGLFQERRFLSRNWEPFPFDPGSVDTLLLTHAHLDHCGLIPRLCAAGFHGRIYATRPSVELAEIVMLDSARIQEEDAAYKTKRHRREGRQVEFPPQPLYTVKDARAALPLFRGIDFNACHDLGDGLSVCFHDAGHVLGSASLTVDVQTDGQRRRILFSGDVGQWDKPLIPDPSLLDAADYVVLESTYGDRNHRDEGDIPTQLAEHVNRSVEQRGNLIIPTFAIERAQELLFHFAELIYAKRIPRVPVFLDSPMAINVTELFEKYRAFLDGDTRARLDRGEHPLDFPGLYLTRTADQSRAINNIRGTAVILAGAGMCTGGRIKHHLAHHIGRKSCTVLFVGYQSPDTLGGQIVAGDSPVRIHGRERDVHATIARLYGLSAHADHDGLLRFLDALTPGPRHVFLTHGEERVALRFADELRQTRKLDVTVPEYRRRVTLD